VEAVADEVKEKRYCRRVLPGTVDFWAGTEYVSDSCLRGRGAIDDNQKLKFQVASIDATFSF